MSNPKPLSLKEIEELLPRLRATAEMAEIISGPLERYVQRSNGHSSGNGHPLAAKRPATRSATKPAKKPTTKPANGVAELQSRVEAHLKSAPAKKGASVSEIVKAIGAGTESVRYALQKLRDTKKARMTGKLAQAKWHAVG